MRTILIVAALVSSFAHETLGDLEPGAGAVLNSIRPAANPHLAFATTSRRWLVAWEEPGGFFGPRISCRLVDSTGAPSGPAFVIEVSGESPRVAYHPAANEFAVVYRRIGDGLDPGGSRIVVQRFSATGAFVGMTTLSPGSSPDVAAGRRNLSGGGNELYWWVLFEQDERVMAQRLSGAGAAAPLSVGPPFAVDVGAPIPETHSAYAARFSVDAPRRALPGGGSDDVRPLVFEVERDVLGDVVTDVWLAALDSTGVRQRLLLSEAAAMPQISWNANSERGVVMALRQAGPFSPWSRLIVELDGEEIVPLGPAMDFGFATSPRGLDSSPLDDTWLLHSKTLSLFGFTNLTQLAGHRLTSLTITGSQIAGPISADRSAAGAGCILVVTLAEQNAGMDDTNVSTRQFCGIESLPNTPPIADAGVDIAVHENVPFALDGSLSHDLDGDPLRFAWQQGGGETAEFISPASGPYEEEPLLVAPSAAGMESTQLVFDLAVDDWRSDPAFPSADSVQVMVLAAADADPPVADAGPDQSADEGQLVQLDGCASFDPDAGEELYFWWRATSVNVELPGVLEQVAFSDATVCNPTFRAPFFGHAGGIDLELTLRVISSRGAFDEDSLVVHVDDPFNDPPVASLIGPAGSPEGVPFDLDASASFDPNGHPLTFLWDTENGRVDEIFRWEDVVSGETLECKGRLFLCQGGPNDGDTCTGNEFCAPGACSSAPCQFAAGPLVRVAATLLEGRDLVLRVRVRDGRGGEGTATASVAIEDEPFHVLDVAPRAGGPGDEITITGTGLFDPDIDVTFGAPDLRRMGTVVLVDNSTLRVIVPNGPPQTREIVDAKLGRLEVTEFPFLRSGSLTVDGPGGTSWTSPWVFQVAHHELRSVQFSQGMPAYDLAQGKDSLLQLDVRTREAGAARLPGMTEALLRVDLSSGGGFSMRAGNPGSMALGNNGHVPLRALDRSAVVDDEDDAVYLLVDGDRLRSPHIGIDAVVRNHGVTVLGVHSLQDSAPFLEMLSPDILIAPIGSFENGVLVNFDSAVFQGRVRDNFEDLRRIFPWPDTEPVILPTVYGFESIKNDAGEIELVEFTDFGAFLKKTYFGFLALSMLHEDYVENEVADGEVAPLLIVGMIDDSVPCADCSVRGVAAAPLEMSARMVLLMLEQGLVVGDTNLADPLIILSDVIGAVTCSLTLGAFCPDPLEEAIKVILRFFDVLIDPANLINAGIDVGKVNFTYLEQDAASTLGQEIGHNLGMVDPLSPGHDFDNPSHSKYDDVIRSFAEAPGVRQPIFDIATGTLLNATLNAASYATLFDIAGVFQQGELLSFRAGGVEVGSGTLRFLLADGRTIVFTGNITDDPPEDLSVIGSASGARAVARNLRLGAKAAHSVMSYAPGKRGGNTFLEPEQYRRLFVAFQADRYRSIAQGAELAATSAGADAAGEEDRLFLSGQVGIFDGTVEIRRAMTVGSEVPITPAREEGPLRIVMRDEHDMVLNDLAIPFSFPFLLPDGPRRELEPIVLSDVIFSVVARLPEEALTVELVWRDEVVWELSREGVAPSVSWTVEPPPVVTDGAVVDLEWSAADDDGDRLFFSLLYSSDGGLTYAPIESDLQQTTYRWVTTTAAGADQARLKIVASDGFHVSEAVSAPFAMSEKPMSVRIVAPDDGGFFAAGDPVHLHGRARTLEQGPVLDDEAYAWSSSLDGALGNGRRLSIRLSPGRHEIRLDVEAGGQPSRSDTVVVEILSDRDGDGLPDAVEEDHDHLDPDDPEDRFRDGDGDGLTDGAEVYWRFTDPGDPDTDDDGIPDGEEVAKQLPPDDSDLDDDGIGDGEDACPRHADPEQLDTDGDGFGDACDVCVYTPDPLQADRDGDDLGDACDCELDGDGVCTEDDLHLLLADLRSGVDTFGLGTDMNGDGSVDRLDRKLFMNAFTASPPGLRRNGRMAVH